MERNEYFKRLVALYEATGMAGTEEVIPQEKIADSGSDVNQAMQGQEQVDNELGQEDPNAEMGGDAEGLMQEDPMMQQPDSTAVMDKQKLVKLFGLFEDLLNYGTVFLDSVNTIDINLLDIEKFKTIRSYINNIDELNKKINEYLTNIFNSENYNKNLYTYVLFRTELITVIKALRDILVLNKSDEKLE